MAQEKTQEKIYVLDTNVLLEDAHALTAFPDSRVVLSGLILEELDRMKTEASYRGRHAREVIRILDGLRQKGSLAKGVPLENNSLLQLIIPEGDHSASALWSHANHCSSDKVDNALLDLAKRLMRTDNQVTLVTRDINLRVKADVAGIVAIDYRGDLVEKEAFYKGWTTLDVPAVQLKKEVPDALLEAHKQKPYTVNEFIILQSQHNPYNARLFRYKGNNQFIAVDTIDLKWSLQARNIQQRMALNLLLDDDIKLITLIGPAGTGKTSLALVAALHEVLLWEHYQRILVTRPIVPLGQDIGYLPGDVAEKLHMWMQPIYDNMDYIIHSAQKTQRALGIYHEEEHHGHTGRKNGKKRKTAYSETELAPLNDLIEQGKISLEAITYMRGRSIPYQYIIIDEVQNLTAHEVKTLISRVGEGSKVVLTGDPYQIDAPHLDFSSNGLIIATERFKGQSLFGTVFLETTERSELSRLAATLL